MDAQKTKRHDLFIGHQATATDFLSVKLGGNLYLLNMLSYWKVTFKRYQWNIKDKRVNATGIKNKKSYCSKGQAM